MADRAKKEPSFGPGEDVINLLTNKDVMLRLAPTYDVADLLIRFGRVRPMIVAQAPSRNSCLSMAGAKRNLALWHRPMPLTP